MGFSARSAEAYVCLGEGHLSFWIHLDKSWLTCKDTDPLAIGGNEQKFHNLR
jgi:hypothetical protein